jgi:hypothetical protein
VKGLMAATALSLAALTLPLCPTEDSNNCVWDAATQGNGEGRSFVVIDEKVTYLNP